MSKISNIILVRPHSETPLKTPPLGIGYLFEAIKNIQGINRIFIDMQRDAIKEEDFLKRIKSLNPLIIGFQLFSVNYASFCRLLPKMRAICPNTKFVAGGPHVSGLPKESLLENSDLDYVVQGEGEEALKLLIELLMGNKSDIVLKNIPNLVYRDNETIIMNEKRIINVNEYGSPDWEILEPHKYPPLQHGIFHKSLKVVPILTSRGCPYSCTFCAGHLLTGKTVRLRRIKDILDEIEYLQIKYKFKEFIISDENFTMDKNHVIQFSNEIAKRKIECYFSFSNGIRIDKIDEEIVYHLKRMGTYIVSLGIESGSQRMLDSMKKNLSLSIVNEKINIFLKYGIITNGFFIMGYTGETKEDIKKTIKFAINSKLDMIALFHYVPLPGTENFNCLIKTGEINLKQINWNNCYVTSYYNIPYHPKDISKKELSNFLKWGILRFYLKPRVFFNFLKRINQPFIIKNLIQAIVHIFFQKHGNNPILTSSETWGMEYSDK